MSTELTELSALADLYSETRDRRLAMQREVDELNENEKKLKVALIAALRAGQAKAIGGQKVILTLKTKNVAVAKNWQAIHEYIIANDAWDLMQKRLLQSGIDARWEEGIVLPGIEAFPTDELSISKRV